MKRVTEREGLSGIQPEAEPGVPFMKTKRAHRIEGANHPLAWHRGKHAGIIDAIVTLEEIGHSEMAEKLRKHYRLDQDGTMGLGM